MIGQRYTIKVYKNPTIIDMITNNATTITEIYIPFHDATFYIMDDKLHVTHERLRFYWEGIRNLEDIELSEEFVDDLMEINNCYEQVKILNNTVSELKQSIDNIKLPQELVQELCDDTKCNKTINTLQTLVQELQQIIDSVKNDAKIYLEKK